MGCKQAHCHNSGWTHCTGDLVHTRLCLADYASAGDTCGTFKSLTIVTLLAATLSACFTNCDCSATFIEGL